ncbi:MAG: RdgB/HAM1 family non-canonical purine NTP pyrophosphatase [Acidimicrobiales bacterium]
MTTFILATANAHKAHEMQAVLADLDVTLLPRPLDVPDVDETEDTLEGNAELKARALVDATGYPALADDTGLFVAALEGRPGVRSARYAGEEASYDDNVRKLLEELHDVPLERRGAEFRTVIVAAYPDRGSLMVVGTLKGSITRSPRGSRGFGYDPVFVPEDETRTLAEMSPEEKNALSHRGHALRALAYALATRSSS